MTASRAWAASVLDRNPSTALRCSQRLVLLLRHLADESRVAPTLAPDQILHLPQRADAENVAHLVGDHVVKSPGRFHLCEIGGIERHDALRRQQGAGTSGIWPNVRRASLPEDAAGTVD